MIKKVILWTLVIVLSFGLIGGVVTTHYLNKVFSNHDQISKSNLSSTKKQYFDKPINILVLGLDQTGNEISRPDTIMIYHLDFSSNTVSLLTVPRDTYVAIPNKGMDKINHAYASGGINLTRDTLEKFLGIKIDYFVVTELAGFVNLIDQIGGITLYVEKDIPGADLKKGLQKLDGKKALAYVRDRSDPMGDIARVKRQQKFMKAVAREVSRYEHKWKLLSNIPQVYTSFKTDLSPEECSYIYALMKNTDSEKLKMELLPGSFYNLNKISYWKPDRTKTDLIVQRIFYDKTP